MNSPWENAPPRRREPIFNMPRVVSWTALVLLALYFVFTLLSPDLQSQIIWDFAFIPARFGELPPQYAELPHSSFGWGILTMVTHAGLHGGIFHLVFNVAWMIAFGTIVARVTGTLGFLAIFVLGAVAGAAAFWAVHPGGMVPVVGASGAISALMGGAARFFFSRRMAPLTDPRLMAFTALWLVVNLVFGIVGFESAGQSGQIAWEAHMGGYFVGLLLIPYFVGRR